MPTPIQNNDLKLSDTLAGDARELVRRLKDGAFTHHSETSTRRIDGSIQVSETIQGPILTVLLSARSVGLSCVVELKIKTNCLFATSVMLRPSSMDGDGDSRELIATPQRPKPEDEKIIENVFISACKCVARGEVRSDENGNFALFLPRGEHSPSLNAQFEIVGLPTLY